MHGVCVVVCFLLRNPLHDSVDRERGDGTLGNETQNRILKARGGFHMSLLSRLLSSFFTALPGSLLIVLFLLTGFLGNEPWWRMFFIVLIILLMSSAFSGLALFTLFQRLGLNRSWVWILVQGLLVWGLALFLLGTFSLTPLCIGQENGDGVNDLAECMERAVMTGMMCTPVYVSLLAANAFIGNWVLKIFRNP